jgi:D-glycero-alpha-D-manno-heptose-7-phosphate kinase
LANIIKKLTGHCRVDFAGGTTDMWPLYCHLGGVRVIHMAIGVSTEVEITYEESPKFLCRISSKELNLSSKHSSQAVLLKDISKSSKQNPLRWIHRVVAACFEKTEVNSGVWHIHLKSDAPPGSGLGGSSVLGVSLAKAIFDIVGVSIQAWDLHALVMNHESAEIEKPAGEQDYVPALFGGFLSFNLSASEKKIEKYDNALGENLASRCAIIHTGKPHHSGINNWDVFRAFHDGSKSVRKALSDIRDLSERMHSLLLKKDLEAFSKLINEEWKYRVKLSSSFDAPVLQEAWNFGKKTGAIARKACGAGGGGSLLLVYKSQEQRDLALNKTLPSKRWTWIPLSLKSEGLYT